MIENNYILDTPLPVNQDFNALKEKGLAYIQEHAGTEWTNFNPSDPGVTILDQCCYALTELGYCNDFPIADILAKPGDKLETDDRFYLPEKILATSPVTAADYREYLLGGLDGVRNVVLYPFANTVMNIYKVYLLIDDSVKTEEIADTCKAAFFYLNKCRNLGELFLMPVPLSPAAMSGLSTAPVYTTRSRNTEIELLSLPAATYRDINSYYSIQHTLPEVFAVGAGTGAVDETDFQSARSRQLKGYLTLFDQLLANQFSQLANLGELFSFKNTLTGAPSVAGHIYSSKESKKKHSQYPVPYAGFSPTYFYQPLYDIPHIKPLLKDHDTFKFGTGLEPAEELEHKSWSAYKQDPYNPYVRGLMESMEDEKTALARRNDLLDHLLARHGESPLLIDAIIDGSKYAGSLLKDQVIFKSLYLQNLDMLSYNRIKACNFFGVKKICEVHTGLNENFLRKITAGKTSDFIFNSQEADRKEKLRDQDFTDYSALELKLCLLFGLRTVYSDYISNTWNGQKIDDLAATDKENIQLALWMILRRRGFVFIETGLLQYCRVADPVSGDEPTLANISSGSDNGVELVFPAFIPEFNTDAFRKRLDLFLQQTMPVGLGYKYRFADADCLQQLIPAFVNWHNALRHPKRKRVPLADLKTYADELAAILTKIN